MKYAVIEEYTIYHEGDERSRTNPGHGYPASSETVQKFREFKDKEEIEKYVKEASKYSWRPKYKLIQFTELTVKTTISVEINNKLELEG